ncbi:Phox homologous domain [Phytophthora cinnamomi]|uniref:Phox homologous domain n=1 Tax=Phytophthora cinnamomi TaxID=4785 RepID=UPI00355A3F4E|nr:Phox homologous domain [Phytophthora cinnamomi]
MNGSMSSLTATITSALALKPSTVYILRVEDAKTRSWHIRRCFSEFCELREKLLALIDDEMATYLTSPEIDIESSFNTRSNISSSASASSSASTCTSIKSYRGKHRHHSPAPTSDRFAFVFKQFPPRKLFGSRSKRVIESRSLALNRFLQQALEVVEVVRQRQLIAICFSMMTHIETFLECGSHRAAAPRVAPSRSVDCNNMKPARRGTVSPSAARRTSAAASLTPGFHHYPLVPTPAFTMTLTDHKYQSCTSRYHLSSSSEEDAGSSDDETQRFNNFDFTRRFYREFGRQEERSETYADESDDDEEMQMLKKTWSAMLESETRERKLYHSGSHFAMLESGHSPAETWAKRIEIAGIHNAAKSNATLSATCPVRTEKSSEPASHRTEQRLRRHRSHQRIHFPTCA